MEKYNGWMKILAPTFGWQKHILETNEKTKKSIKLILHLHITEYGAEAKLRNLIGMLPNAADIASQIVLPPYNRLFFTHSWT